MKRLFARLLAFIAGLLILIALLFTSLQYCLMDEDWFQNEYESLGTAGQIGIPTEDCTRAIMQLIYYMEGDAESIQLDVTENGVTVAMYNEREIAHMTDVQRLYQAFRTVRNAGCIVALALLLLCWLLMRKRTLRTWGEGYITAAKVLGVIIVGLGVWVAVDFNSFWVAFHHLFFDNDLWLLDYATSRMIRICPEQLFFDIVVRFALLFLIPFAILLVLSILFRGWGRRREKEEAQADE